MPICPIKSEVEIRGPCKETSCYLNVSKLDYNCLQLHCDIYDMSTSEVLTSLYGKAYNMTVALAIKATRVAFALKDLKPKPDREIQLSIERDWVKEIKNAGPLPVKDKWTSLTERNKKYKFRDRMLQVLNTMEAYEFPLKEVLDSYYINFYKLDLQAFCIDAKYEKQLLRLIGRSHG